VLCLILLGGFGLMFSVAFPVLGRGTSLSNAWVSLTFFLAPLLTFFLAWGTWKMKKWARWLVLLSHSIGFLAGVGILLSLIKSGIHPLIGLFLLLFNGLVAAWFLKNGKYFHPATASMVNPPDIQ
jgi:hypothetical protein